VKVVIATFIHPGALGYSVQRGFEALGIESVVIPYPRWTASTVLPKISGMGRVSRIFQTLTRPAATADLLKQLRLQQPDLLLLLKCDTLPPVSYRLIRRVCNAKIVAFHPDDPFNVGNWRRAGPSHPHAVAQLREVDVYFTWARHLIPKLQQRGARRCEYLPFACDPAFHPRPTQLDHAHASDVCFVGNWDPHREKWLAHIARMDVDLAIWGNEYWSRRCKDPRVRDAWRGRAIVGEQLASAVASSRINVNILRLQNQNACNMRTFEIPCVGGFMLHERSDELDALFPPGQACAVFDSPAELVDKIEYYLSHEEERARIVEAGYQAAMRQTYKQWAMRILEACGMSAEAKA